MLGHHRGWGAGKGAAPGRAMQPGEGWGQGAAPQLQPRWCWRQLPPLDFLLTQEKSHRHWHRAAGSHVYSNWGPAARPGGVSPEAQGERRGHRGVDGTWNQPRARSLSGCWP